MIIVEDLGVIIDSKLSLSAHVAALCRTGFYHLRQLRCSIELSTGVDVRACMLKQKDCSLIVNNVTEL